MKPIIVDMTDISDSVEVYESKPNPFMVYLIYILAALLITAVGWMWFSKMDIVVKSSGIFRSEESAVNVSVGINGQISSCNIEEGQYVNEGDILFTVDADSSIENEIKAQEVLYDDITDRIEILKAYERYLNGENAALNVHEDNKYYKEFEIKKEKLASADKNTDTEIYKQKEQLQNEINSIKSQRNSCEQQISKLEQAEQCVKNRNNSFSSSESYYESLVSSYISKYNLTATQYDTQIADYEKQKEALDNKINDGQTSGSIDVESIKKQLEDCKNAISRLSGEKKITLDNLELQQISVIEQQITTVKETLSAAENSLSALKDKLKVINESGNSSGDINILTEKQSVAAEILSFNDKKRECENILKQYDSESGKATVMAQRSGYIYMLQEITEGNYIAQGTAVCQILPENTKGYYAEIYVENQDIAKLKEGQEVKFEIAAYPSNEYGYFTGNIESISKDIKVNQNSGSAYYLVKVRCDQTTVTNKDGKTGSIINGMACNAKVVVDEKNVLEFVLEKLDLLD